MAIGPWFSCMASLAGQPTWATCRISSRRLTRALWSPTWMHSTTWWVCAARAPLQPSGCGRASCVLCGFVIFLCYQHNLCTTLFFRTAFITTWRIKWRECGLRSSRLWRMLRTELTWSATLKVWIVYVQAADLMCRVTYQCNHICRPKYERATVV